MPSTPTTRNRLEKQETGENEDAWGDILNDAVIALIDAGMDGWAIYALSGSKTLTSVNYEADEARMRVQSLSSGTGGTVTVPSVEKWYWVLNTTSGDVVVTTGSGATATVPSTGNMAVFCDGTNCRLMRDQAVYLAGKLYADGLNTAMTTYVNEQISSVVAGGLPTPVAGKFLTNDGTTFFWDDVGDGLFEAVSSNITLGLGGRYGVDTTAARNLALPASDASGQTIVVADTKGLAQTNNITLTRDGSDTITAVVAGVPTSDTTLVINRDLDGVTLIAVAGGWSVLL